MTMGINATSHWQSGYFVVSMAMVILSVIFLFTKDMWEGISASSREEDHDENNASLSETIKSIQALLSVALFFLYTGVELGLGLWIYSLLTESRGVAPEVAGIVTGGYWAMFTVGRIFAGWYAKKIDVRKLIYLSISLALFGVALLLADSSQIITILGVTLAGFAIAPIFPGLVSSTTSRVGFRHQANTIGMQIAAAGLGVAVVPSIAGVLARIFGLEVIPLYLLSTLALLLLVFIISNSHSGENT
jgi:fucose permease